MLQRTILRFLPRSIPARSLSNTTDPNAHILLERRQHVQWITLNRPAKYNALTIEMFSQIIEALQKAAVDEEIRFAVMTGVGEYYSAGNDLNNFTRTLAKCDGDLDAALEIGVQLPHQFAQAFINFPKPLIGVINGPAIGIMATTLALMDCIIASDTATFSTPFSSLGQTPESCSTFTFPQILGPSVASSMLYFNAKLTATEAYNRGLVSTVVVREHLLEHVEQLLYGEENGWVKSCYPGAMMRAKGLVRDEKTRQMLIEISRKECELLRSVFKSDECQEALVKFFNRKEEY